MVPPLMLSSNSSEHFFLFLLPFSRNKAGDRVIRILKTKQNMIRVTVVVTNAIVCINKKYAKSNSKSIVLETVSAK